MLTCTGVSFAHGSNDGQKGMGLVLLILIGILPATYALNLGENAQDLRKLEASATVVQPILDGHAAAAGPEAITAGSGDLTPKQAAELTAFLRSDGKLTPQTYAAVAAANRHLVSVTSTKAAMAEVPSEQAKPFAPTFIWWTRHSPS